MNHTKMVRSMESRGSKFIRTAKVLRAVTVLLMLFAIFSMLSPLWEPTSLELLSQELRFNELPAAQRWMVWLMWNAGSAVWVYALYQVQHLFQLQAGGAIFTRATIRCMTVFGICLVFEPLVESVSFVVLEVYLGGIRELQLLLSIVVEEILFVAEDIYIGLLILFMANLLEQGRKLSQELELTI
ncbi:MAG: DUF2975 domain-containing protein [Pseudomonadota bacterium]